jgi:hypothetical protein
LIKIKDHAAIETDPAAREGAATFARMTPGIASDGTSEVPLI